MRLLLTQNPTLKTQNFFLFILGFLLVFCLFSSPCFAQGVLARPMERLPSLPNLPSGERIYDPGGASPDQPEELDSVSRPVDIQGELKTDTDGVKANKYNIGYNGNTKRIEGRIEKSRGTEQEDLQANEPPGQTLRLPDARSSKRIEGRIEKSRGTEQEDLQANEPPGQTLRLPDAHSLGFQYQPPLLGRMGFDTFVRKPKERTQD